MAGVAGKVRRVPKMNAASSTTHQELPAGGGRMCPQDERRQLDYASRTPRRRRQDGRDGQGCGLVVITFTLLFLVVMPIVAVVVVMMTFWGFSR